MTEAQAARRDVVTWAGCAVVGGAAAVMSFTALSDLARRMGVLGAVGVHGWTFQVAWLLPITIDILAAVSTRVWLRRLGGWEAVRFARRAAWGAIVATVGGNAYHGYLTGHGDVDVVVVAAVPAVVFGTIVHLGMLIGCSESTQSLEVARERWWRRGWRWVLSWLGRLSAAVKSAASPRRRSSDSESLSEPAPVVATCGDQQEPGGPPVPALHSVPNSTPPGDEAGDRVAELIAGGAGRRRLMKECGLTEHEARTLLERHRNGTSG